MNLLQKHEPDTDQLPDVAAEATHPPPGGRVGHQGVAGLSRPAAMVSADLEDFVRPSTLTPLAAVYDVPHGGRQMFHCLFHSIYLIIRKNAVFSSCANECVSPAQEGLGRAPGLSIQIAGMDTGICTNTTHPRLWSSKEES